MDKACHKYRVIYQDIEVEIEQLPNGKFKIPSLGQFTKQGLGSVWLDDGRIPYESKEDKKNGQSARPSKTSNANEGNIFKGGLEGLDRSDRNQLQGRFPANLLVSDDALNDGKSRGVSGSARLGKPHTGGHKSGFMVAPQTDNISPSDSGSFSRYFSLDSWFAKKLSELPTSVQKTFPFLIVPKASKTEKNRGCEGLEKELGHNRFDRCKKCGGYILQNPDRPSACKCEKPEREHNRVKGNFHPTTKPLKLMSYLITLGSREGDVVLDPFIGSGTTAIAARILSRCYIGFEIDPDYCKIAKKRLETEETLWNREGD